MRFIVDHRDQLWAQSLVHVRLVGTALLLAVPVAMVVGVVASTRPRLMGALLGTASVIITVPSFALFGLFIAPLGLGFRAAVVTLSLYALLPVLRNTVTGLRGVPADVVEAAWGMGMTPAHVLMRVRIPLALPVVVAGIRVATVMIVGIATIASLITAGGLGTFIFSGLRSGDRAEILAATWAIVTLALVADGGLALLQRALQRGGPARRTQTAPAPASIVAS